MSKPLKIKYADDQFAIFATDLVSSYRPSEFRTAFNDLQNDGLIQGKFEDQTWICSSDTDSFPVNFDFDIVSYSRSLKKTIKFTPSELTDLLKYYTLYICGSYIFQTISDRISRLRDFFSRYGTVNYEISSEYKHVIIDFLTFIGLPDTLISEIEANIPLVKSLPNRQRDLAPLINYLVIDNEITDMYDLDISEEDFVKWFPIYFWTKVTLILPLRPTEILFTPFDCLKQHTDGSMWISIRRTLLKKGHLLVYYDVDKDYKKCEYPISNERTITVIQKYLQLTSYAPRRFLFLYNKLSKRKIYSYSAFSILINAFVKNYIIGNPKYNYAKFASGISEFSTVSLGDSRPIALSNMFYQGIDAEICRQLAGHEQLVTTYGYYENISKTILASSIVKIQRDINHHFQDIEKINDEYTFNENSSAISIHCRYSPQPYLTGDYSICMELDQQESCFGCKYHMATKDELSNELSSRKAELEKTVELLAKSIFSRSKKQLFDKDKIMLDLHTCITRYMDTTDECALQEKIKWLRHQNTMTV